MNVSCPECQSVFRVDPARIPGASVRARCSVCGGIILIAAGSDARDDFATATVAAPPRTSTATPPVPPSIVPRGATPPVPAPAIDPPSAAAPVIVPTPARQSTPVRPSTPVMPPPAVLQAPIAPAVATTIAPTPATLPAAVPFVAPRAAPPAGLPLRPVTPGMPAPFARPSSSLTPPTSRQSMVAPPVARPSSNVPPAPFSRPSVAAPAGAASPPVAPRPGAPAPAVARAAPAPAAGAPARVPINPFLANDPNAKAKRLARALVSDIIAYFPGKRDEGVRDGTLKQLFREEIKKSYEEYVDQIGKEFADSTTHFQDALNDILAQGKKLF